MGDSFHLPALARAAAVLRKFDWRRREVIDAAVIIGFLVLMYVVSDHYDLPAKLFQFARDHADWDVDDLIFVVMTLSIALLVYVNRRRRDLATEIIARRSAEAESHRLARHDPLTGLPNRRFFTEKLGDALRQGAADNERTAVLLLDLDGFKAINDSHGHAVGDEALIEFATRVTSVIRAGTFMARVGGDEFAIVMTKIGSGDPARLTQRIMAALAKPLSVRGLSVTLGVGIGISVAPDDGNTQDDVVRRADLALYRAKAEGRSLVRSFETEMDKQMERRALIEGELRQAITSDAVTVHYQPLVSLEGGRIIGFEALARWVSPTVGPVPPLEFITIAEECGLIVELGEQLLRTACREAARWPADLTLSFNLSPIQLRDPTLGLRIMRILGDTGLSPDRLEVEVTESAVVSDAAAAQTVIAALHGAGVRIALDDFGTGYATMSQLLTLRFDKIKIDRSFIERLGKDSQSDVIVRATIGLAKGLGLVTTAEGIETADQLATLLAEGCVQGQGYLFGRGVPADEIAGLLNREVQAVA
jgi:diguanylate cyclase (GGDEF)-like protein